MAVACFMALEKGFYIPRRFMHFGSMGVDLHVWQHRREPEPTIKDYEQDKLLDEVCEGVICYGNYHQFPDLHDEMADVAARSVGTQADTVTFIGTIPYLEGWFGCFPDTPN